MQERSVRFTTRYAPPMEEVVEKLKEKLSGPQNAGELMSELCQKLGEYRLIQLVFLRPRILVRGHSILTILLTERKDETAAELLEISTSAHYYGDSGSHSYRREAEEVLRELGFTGESDAELEEQEQNGLISAVKNWWRKE